MNPTIKAVAETHGLTIAEVRCVTGNRTAGGFFTYELTHPDAHGQGFYQLHAACKELKRQEFLAELQWVNVPDHPEFGSAYLEVSSVYHITNPNG